MQYVNMCPHKDRKTRLFDYGQGYVGPSSLFFLLFKHLTWLYHGKRQLLMANCIYRDIAQKHVLAEPFLDKKGLANQWDNDDV